MKRLILILATIGIIANIYSQSTMLWSKDFTTGLNSYPTIQTIADTIKVIGSANIADGQKLLIINYDLKGDIISTKTYGDESVSNNSIIDYKFDTTNHVYILHSEQLEPYKSKIVLQKYSLNGDLVWVEQIQSLADTSYIPHSLGLINDDCLFIATYKEYDYHYPEPDDDVIIPPIRLSYLYAFSSVGNQLWRREFDPNIELNLFINSIFVYNNTAFLFTVDNTSYTYKIVKVDTTNQLTMRSASDLQRGANNIQLTPDNNLLITSGVDYRITKMDMNGTVLWTQYYGTNLPHYTSGDRIISTLQDSYGNIYITGKHYKEYSAPPNYTDILTIKYDKNGNLIWQNRYEVNDAPSMGNTIVVKNGQVYVGGQSQNDYIVLKIDSVSGITTGIYRHNEFANGNNAVSSLSVFDNGNVALTGLSNINFQYYWTTQLLSDIILSVQKISVEDNIKVYPNPVTRGETLTIAGKGVNSYSIISAIGQVVKQGQLGVNDLHTVQLDNIETGIYFLYLKTDNEVLNRKIIVR